MFHYLEGGRDLIDVFRMPSSQLYGLMQYCRIISVSPLSCFSVVDSNFFQSRGGKEVRVGPKTLPSGLPSSTVPEKITTLVNESKSPEDDDARTASTT